MEETLMLIKPDAVSKQAAGKIIARVEEAGFIICGLQMLQLTTNQARAFYQEHAERPFFDGLVAFMTSGPIIALRLSREDGIKTLRALVGATDSRKAEPDTIRGQFGTDNQQNAVHASDSPSSAARETAFFFSTIHTFKTSEE